jgi:hypothetical protein
MTDILRRARLVNREVFDPTNAAHLLSLKVFLATGNWGDVQFYPEAPFTEAPATVLTKYARHVLGVVPQTDEERAAAHAARGVLPFPRVLTRDEREHEAAARLAKANELMNVLRGQYTGT